MTNNLERRLYQHQHGQSRSTAPYRPFCLLFSEEYEDSLTARNREKYLKTAAGKRFIRKKYAREINNCI